MFFCKAEEGNCMSPTDSIMIIWLVLLVLFLGIEVATLGLTTIWFAGGALVAIIAGVAGATPLLQGILFVMVSVLLLFFTRPIALKYFNKDRIKTNVEDLVGKQAIVIHEINNLQGTGQVVVNGQEWSARTLGNEVEFPVGTVVKILAIHGVKLIVGKDEMLDKS